MFTVQRREQVSEQLVDRARADERVVGVARTGAAARGAQDRWSDIDLFLGIGQHALVTDVLTDWTSWLYADLDAVHHFDLHAGAATYRAFLLADRLEVDLGLTPADSFGPLGGGAFDIVFGQPAAPQNSPPDPDHLIGLGWHHVLHARVAIARGAPWQAEHWISALRDHTMALGCIRHGLPFHFGKGAGQLPAAEYASLARALVTSLDRHELTRALSAAVGAFLAEIQQTDPSSADRLRPILVDAADTEH